MPTVLLMLTLVGAYLLGAIPFSLIIGLRVKGIDLRHCGSGNLGATNVYRNLGAGWAGLCFALDLAKGVLAVLVMTIVVQSWPVGRVYPLHFPPDLYRIIAGFFAILGHSFSPFVGFKGGKGIATSFGVCLVLEPFPSLIAFGIFLAVFLAGRIVSLGSIAAMAVFPWAVVFFEYRSPRPLSKTLVVFGFVLSALAIWRHRANIRRLKSGTEKPLGSPPDPVASDGDDEKEPKP